MRWLRPLGADVEIDPPHRRRCRRRPSRRPPRSPAIHGSSANVAPVTRIDSPSAMMTNSPQRSAMWPPSTSQSAVVERPSPGVQKPSDGRQRTRSPAPRSTGRAARSPSANAPAIQNTRRQRQPGGDALEVAVVAGAVPAQRPQHEQAAPDLHERRRRRRTPAPCRRTPRGSRSRAPAPPASARTASAAPASCSGSSQLVTQEV